MDQSAFDRISKLFAAKAARRAALTTAAGAAALAAAPAADARKKRRKPKPEEKTEFLFVQAAKQGTLADNGDGTWDLVLQGHTGGTIYFSDRPQRVFGVSPTEAFLEGLGFPELDPPNAALLVSADGVEDAAIVELFDPVFDEPTGRLTYTVRILGAYEDEGLSFINDQITDADLPVAFDEANLFIDDCADFSLCADENSDAIYEADFTGHQTGRCWKPFDCGECWPGEIEALDKVCTDQFGEGFYLYT